MNARHWSIVLAALVSAAAAAGNGASHLIDPQAGYVLDLDDADAWVSEVSYSPGITSKLCIERASPSMLVCVQSLIRPIAIEERQTLADGYFAGIGKRFPGVSRADLLPATFGFLSGVETSFETSSAELPPARRWVIAFAGTNAEGQPQMAIAFADPADADRARAAFERVLASIVYLRGT